VSASWPRLDRDACYRALETRDARFDGSFFTAVRTTGIYCRPICPARTPKLDNCIFVPSAAAAHALGFRPCLRCRPEAAPGSPLWRGSETSVTRALHLIAEGALDGDGVEALAERLGMGARHLRRLFERHLGASPLAVARTHRLLFAKRLLAETALPVGEVALASGFGSIRQFNADFRCVCGRTPREVRRARRVDSATVSLSLAFAPPYDWRGMLDFLAARALPGVEAVEPDRYRRTFAIGRATGVVEVRLARGERALVATIRGGDVVALGAIVARVRRLFDLDANGAVIDAHLARDPRLAPLVKERPGMRVPGAWDEFELAVRAVLGQHVRVSVATALASRLVAQLGAARPDATVDEDLTGLFPVPSAVARAELSDLGVPRARAAALRALAIAASDERAWREVVGRGGAGLRSLEGFGPWTAEYVAMRALGEPDAFPASDVGLRRALATLAGRPGPAAAEVMAERWRPWRAYAAVRLWTQATGIRADRDRAVRDGTPSARLSRWRNTPMPQQTPTAKDPTQQNDRPDDEEARQNDPELQNEGEGSRSAARRYDEGAEQAASDPERVKQLAEEAERALAGTEGDELREADTRGKNANHA
jgi:AraC family transcriptional regulator of adaptative response / DNA-3-methyladenine glycosylase II